MKDNFINNEYYVCYCKNEDIRRESSSGGIFYLLAEKVIKDDGVVFAARFTADFTVIHEKCESVSDIHHFMGSKYLQSHIGNMFSEIRYELNNDRKVLFTGTPCQVAGLKTYLRKVYENLILVDFVCHGVPAPLLWKKYLDEQFNGRSITKINFRNKSDGWQDFCLKIEFTDGKCYKKSQYDDLYMRGFLKNLTLRPSCYKCHFKPSQDADITLSDFWGVQKLAPDFYDNKGVSLIMLHSLKGKQLFETIKQTCRYKEVDLPIVKKSNPSYFHSVKKPEERQILMSSKGEEILKVMNSLTKEKLRRKVAMLVKRKFRKYLGRR